MHTTRKLTGATAIGAAVALVLSGCSAEEAPSSSAAENRYDDVIDVAFGYIPSYNGSSLLAIAEDQGLWETYGLNVTATTFTNGPLQIQALGTGDLDFGYIGPGAIWLPASGQAKIIAMNTLGQADRVVAQPGIDSVEDLSGRSVAFPEGTSGDMILTLALEAAGMTKDDIVAVPMEPAAIVAAFASNQVDAAALWYPLVSTIEEQVPDLEVLATNEDFEESVAFPTAFVAGNDVVADEPEKVERMLKALRDALAWRTANPEETIELVAAHDGIEAADVAQDASTLQILSLDEIDELTQDGTIDTWLSGLVDYFVGAGKLEAPVEPSEFYTGDLFLEAAE